MSWRSTGRLLTVAVALTLSAPLTASPALADDAGPTVQITSPDEFSPDGQSTVTVDVHTPTPVADDVWVVLDIMLPSRLDAVSTEATGLVCSVTTPQDVTCTGMSAFSGGSVQVTVDVGPGNVTLGTIQASLSLGNDEPVNASKDVHIAGTPSGLDVQINAPDRLEPGDPVTIEVTGHTDQPVTDGSVGISVDLNSNRLSALSATAQGFDCTIRPRQDLGGGSFAPSGADCSATSLADTVTLTMTVNVEPGVGARGSVDASMGVGDSFASQSADIVVVGSDATTVSGLVWNDLDRDGRQDQGEPGVAGVTVTGPISFTTTGADGRYELTGEDRGDTAILFVAPGKFDFTKPNVGGDEGDSDVTTVTRECPDCVMGSLSLTVSGPTTVDAGLFDPKVPVPTESPTPTHTTPAPQAGTVPHTLANTGAPIAGLTAIGALLLAAGVGLTLVRRRRLTTPQD